MRDPRIRIRVAPERKNEICFHAHEAGFETLNEFVLAAIESFEVRQGDRRFCLRCGIPHVPNSHENMFWHGARVTLCSVCCRSLIQEAIDEAYG